MKYTLPMPPSVNAMYRRNPKGYGMYKTPEAKMWIAECLRHIRRKNPLKGKIDVSVEFYFQREADIDNRLKPLLDLLQEANVVENDKQVYSLVVTKFFDKVKPRVELVVQENN